MFSYNCLKLEKILLIEVITALLDGPNHGGTWIILSSQSYPSPQSSPSKSLSRSGRSSSGIWFWSVWYDMRILVLPSVPFNVKPTFLPLTGNLRNYAPGAREKCLWRCFEVCDSSFPPGRFFTFLTVTDTFENLVKDLEPFPGKKIHMHTLVPMMPRRSGLPESWCMTSRL